MDVLQPQLVWIEGRCYRKNYVSPDSNEPQREQFSTFQEQDDAWDDGGNCVGSKTEPEIEQTAEGRFKVSIPVPSAFYGKIIGFKGQAKKRMEMETKTRISVPNTEGNIVIDSSDRSSICSAVLRINMIVSRARDRMTMTHFLCLPLNQQETQNAMHNFKEEVLHRCAESRGLDPSLFQNPEKLHLTLGTLVLLNSTERDTAANILTEAKSRIDDLLIQKPLCVCIQGLEYMNDDPAEVDVLYAKVNAEDNSNRLQDLSELVIELYRDSGLMPKQFDRVKVHLTVLNTAFRKSEGEFHPGGNRRQRRETFDAREILKYFGNHYFATVNVTSVDLSQLHSTTSKDGFYVASTRLALP